jgi:hypothetical protein
LETASPNIQIVMFDDEIAGHILLDTNVFYADLHGRGTSTAILAQGVERLHYLLLLPEVVKDETIEKYRQELVRKANSYHQIVGDVRNFLPSWRARDLPEDELESHVRWFAESFPYSIHKSRIVLLPYPSTTHQELTKRALQRQKPFNEKGSGYRDSLICDTMKEWLLANKGASLYYVSQNHKDFFDGSGLHSDIRRRFKEGGIDPTRIKCFSNLGELNREFFLPHLESLDQLAKAIQSGAEKRFIVSEWIEQDLIELLQGGEWGRELVGIHGLRAYPIKCRTPSIIKVDDVRLLPSGDFLLYFSTRLTVQVSITFDEFDFERNYNEMVDLVGKPDLADMAGTAWIDVNTYLGISLMLNKDTLEVAYAQVDELEGRQDFYETSSHPHES